VIDKRKCFAKHTLKSNWIDWPETKQASSLLFVFTGLDPSRPGPVTCHASDPAAKHQVCVATGDS